MSLTKLTESLNIIQGLADKPTQTASQLKEAFDTAGNKIKSYINDHLTSELDTALGTKANSSEVYTKTETDTLLGAKANITDVSSLIQYEDVVISVSGGTDDVNTVSSPGSYTKPTGYKVLTANIISCDNNIYGPVISSILGINDNPQQVWISSIVIGRIDADITVRIIYIKE